MTPILIASIAPFSGKNVAAVGMAKKLQADGKKVGYFKPLGPLLMRENHQLTDEDAIFFKRVLGLKEPLDVLCPVVLSDETVADTLRGSTPDVKKTIHDAYETIAADKDVVFMLSMGNLCCGRSLGYRMSELVRDIDAKVVIVDRYRWPMEALDGLLGMKEALGEALAAVVFNKVSSARKSQIEQAVTPYLKAQGIEVFGSLPTDQVLYAVAVSDIVDALGGKVLCCNDQLDQLVEEISIGAMHADAALKFLRRRKNQVVITGGDRSDIHLAALESSTRCLLLTGNHYPNERILARAEEQGVPIVIVGRDTSRAAEICKRVRENLSLRSERKVARIVELAETHLNWDLIRETLAID